MLTSRNRKGDYKDIHKIVLNSVTYVYCIPGLVVVKLGTAMTRYLNCHYHGNSKYLPVGIELVTTKIYTR